LKRVRGTATCIFAILCVIGLAGCSALPRGYVSHDGSGYALKVVPGCDKTTFKQVMVKYASDTATSFEDQETVWSVAFPDNSKVTSVTLFRTPPGAVDEYISPNIDTSRQVLVWWNEGGGFEGSLSGVLDDIPSGAVLWSGGFEDAGEFVDKATSRSFGC